MTEPSLSAILARIESIEQKLDVLLAALAELEAEDGNGERDQSQPL